MEEKDTLFLQLDKSEDFIFDERVARVFDDMVSRSIPYYGEIQRIQSDIIMSIIQEKPSIVCDLGCSTGTTIKNLVQHQKCHSNIKFIGYDNSEPMLLKAKNKLEDAIKNNKVELHNVDISRLSNIPMCDVIILNWTLQFIRPIDRNILIRNCFDSLKNGGVILLSEKIICKHSILNRLYIDHFLQFKLKHGEYTDIENQRKRESLENVLIPYRLDENYELLEQAGFKCIDTYFQWFNFCCLIAIKT